MGMEIGSLEKLEGLENLENLLKKSKELSTMVNVAMEGAKQHEETGEIKTETAKEMVSAGEDILKMFRNVLPESTMMLIQQESMKRVRSFEKGEKELEKDQCWRCGGALPGSKLYGLFLPCKCVR